MHVHILSYSEVRHSSVLKCYGIETSKVPEPRRTKALGKTYSEVWHLVVIKYVGVESSEA